MKKATTFAAALFAGLCASSLASADQVTGKITGDHLNGTVPNRGACIRLVGVAPGTGWFCNYSEGNFLYDEINNLLLGATVTRPGGPLICKIDYVLGGGPDGHNKINWISCPPVGGGA